MFILFSLVFILFSSVDLHVVHAWLLVTQTARWAGVLEEEAVVVECAVCGLPPEPQSG